MGLDTSVSIYHFGGTGCLSEAARVVLDELAWGDFVGVTSIRTLMEIVAKPLQVGRPEVAEEYDVLLGRLPNLLIADIDHTVSRRAARLSRLLKNVPSAM